MFKLLEFYVSKLFEVFVFKLLEFPLFKEALFLANSASLKRTKQTCQSFPTDLHFSAQSDLFSCLSGLGIIPL